ncbi:MAG: hypothetical protein OXT72_00585 [Gammaproteobacteria bacterium]|nr:hypothetical protein [Gammaproteobacteria bacterium]MDE0246686.1 hypothetical protein [Gammaproteobacteria bacterium]
MRAARRAAPPRARRRRGSAFATCTEPPTSPATDVALSEGAAETEAAVALSSANFPTGDNGAGDLAMDYTWRAWHNSVCVGTGLVNGAWGTVRNAEYCGKFTEGENPGVRIVNTGSATADVHVRVTGSGLSFTGPGIHSPSTDARFNLGANRTAILGIHGNNDGSCTPGRIAKLTVSKHNESNSNAIDELYFFVEDDHCSSSVNFRNIRNRVPYPTTGPALSGAILL